MFHVYGPKFGWKTNTIFLLKLYSMACFHLFRFIIHFIWQTYLGSSFKTLWEIPVLTNFCLTTMQLILLKLLRSLLIIWIYQHHIKSTMGDNLRHSKMSHCHSLDCNFYVVPNLVYIFESVNNYYRDLVSWSLFFQWC